MVESAGKIIGLDFTDAERDSMLSGLNDRLKSYEEMRKVELDNSVPPAILFNPIPVGMKFETKQKPFVTSSSSSIRMPENIEDLAYYSIGELAYLIKNRKVSSEALTKMYIGRLKKYGPRLECVITLTEDLAIEEARQADKEIAQGKYRGMLHGIPYGAKDLLAKSGYKTTWGAMPYKDQVIDVDATVIKKLHQAGAVLAAKLSMGALAWGDVWFGGMTRNPWDVTKGSSGSSAGSASAVSAGLLPFAIGTETWGSIVSPCTVCGVSGLRPTYGRVSRMGAMALSWSMDKIGPICRNVEDCAIVLRYIYGPDGIDQTLYEVPFNYDYRISLKGLKIGYLKNDFSHNYAFKENDARTLEVLKSMGAELVPVELPGLPINAISFILDAEAAAVFDDLTRSKRDGLMVRQIKDAWPNVFRQSRFIPAVEYINANRIRYKLIQQMDKMLKGIDLYVAPSDEGDNSLATNLTGHPLVVVPNGFTKEGLPTSITFVGKLFDEGRIVAVAKAYQDKTGYHLKHPKLNL
ncbi:MAG: amidase [Ignavibacteria bacterium]|nr:amidase [Ignavibacteria bacterium]MCU7503487.1 amidase [Ignavibacteria bacterium]MCU7516181.1 amidase [Ignavibacteria bacterium]